MNQSFNSTTISSQQEEEDLSISWSTVAVTVICSFGVLTNLINIAVFLNPSLKDATYRFMLSKSVVELIYVLINIFNILVYCGAPCDSNFTSFAGQVFNLGFSSYFTSCLAIFGVLIENFISLKRLLLIKNKRTLENMAPYRVLLTLLIVAFLYYAPVFLVQKINEIPISRSLKIYLPGSTDLGQTSVGKLILPVLTGLRIVLTVVCLPIINIISLIEFRKYMRRKESVRGSSMASSRASQLDRISRNNSSIVNKNDEVSMRVLRGSVAGGDDRSIGRCSEADANRRGNKNKNTRDYRAILNINRMVLLISTFYILGSLPYTIYFICSQFISVPFIYASVAYIAISLMHGTNIFIYYLFNNQFNQILNSYFKKLCIFF